MNDERWVYLVHHGQAAAPDVDHQRKLTAAGLEHVARLASDAALRGVKPAVIWHSGKARARQTAEAFWRACNPLAEFAAVRGLQPDDPPDWMRDRISSEGRDVMLVGHMPNLPKLLGQLTTPGSQTTLPRFPLHGLVALIGQQAKWVEQFQLGPFA